MRFCDCVRSRDGEGVGVGPGGEGVVVVEEEGVEPEHVGVADHGAEEGVVLQLEVVVLGEAGGVEVGKEAGVGVGGFGEDVGEGEGFA